MIQILMLDLGDTLVHGEKVFSHVPDALETLRKFKTAAGKPLALCLVSDFGPSPPVPQEKIGAIFQEYLAHLEQFGLAKFFKPPTKHVTLSANAGAFKPDQRLFEKAIERLDLKVGLDACLFITEQAEHITACQQLGMKTLQFGASSTPGAEFSDWSEAPLLISQLVAPDQKTNIELALKVRLAATHGMEFVAMKSKPQSGSVSGQAQKWHPVPDPQQGGQDIHVQLPVEVEISLDEQGHVQSVKGDQPDPAAVAEATHYVKTLEDNKQISHEPGPLPPDATHQVETDEQGRKRLVRKRFSAI
jgi:hypothetical protein